VSGPAEVITAVPTPFTESGDLDLVAARELFGFVARTTGRMFVAGTTGEFPALTDAERLSLIKTALDVAGTRRVLVHVGAADAHRARLLTEAASPRRGSSRSRSSCSACTRRPASSASSSPRATPRAARSRRSRAPSPPGALRPGSEHFPLPVILMNRDMTAAARMSLFAANRAKPCRTYR